jgi:hypothetical protein
MACRFIVIDGVSFDSHHGKAGEWLQKAFEKQPVSMRVLYLRDSAGKVVWYVQASLDVDTRCRAPRLWQMFNGKMSLWRPR